MYVTSGCGVVTLMTGLPTFEIVVELLLELFALLLFVLSLEELLLFVLLLEELLLELVVLVFTL